MGLRFKGDDKDIQGRYSGWIDMTLISMSLSGRRMYERKVKRSVEIGAFKT